MRELLQKAGAVGLLGHDVPEEYGGLGGDKTSSSLITEAASRQGSFAVSFGAHVGHRHDADRPVRHARSSGRSTCPSSPPAR